MSHESWVLECLWAENLDHETVYSSESQTWVQRSAFGERRHTSALFPVAQRRSYVEERKKAPKP